MKSLHQNPNNPISWILAALAAFGSFWFLPAAGTYVGIKLSEAVGIHEGSVWDILVPSMLLLAALTLIRFGATKPATQRFLTGIIFGGLLGVAVCAFAYLHAPLLLD